MNAFYFFTAGLAIFMGVAFASFADPGSLLQSGGLIMLVVGGVAALLPLVNTCV
jgi:hypothetical protein